VKRLVGYHCLGYEARPLWGGRDPGQFHHWRELARDLIQFLSEVTTGPVIGVGHSLGAITTLYGAAARPELFRAVVLIDPVIFPLPMSPVLAVAVKLGLSSRARLPTLTRRRRMEWPSREAVFDSFRRASVLARWTDTALWDYVVAVTEAEPAGGVRLRYPRDWEARIFETVPPDSWLMMPRLRRIPTLVLRGELSTTFTRGAMRTMRWFMPGARYVEVEGADHFVPMMHPEKTAELVLAFLEGL
jgi:pimeloyl-ACP methyl ester carboxylesterase